MVNGLRNLRNLGSKAEAAVPAMLPLLESKDEKLREAAISAMLSVAPKHEKLTDVFPAEAHVNGKYAKLLRRMHVPEDVQNYGKFKDWGHYTGTTYRGFTDLPAGYWVYAEPNWYIWGEQKK